MTTTELTAQLTAILEALKATPAAELFPDGAETMPNWRKSQAAEAKVCRLLEAIEDQVTDGLNSLDEDQD